MSEHDQDKVDHLLADLNKLRRKHDLKQFNSTTLPTKLDQNKKEHFHIEASLPRIGPSRSRHEKILAFDQEIKQITKAMEEDQRIEEYYQAHKTHHLIELEKVEATYTDSKAKVLRQYLEDQLDHTSEEVINKLGTPEEQTLRHKLRSVRLEHITSQLSALKENKVDEQNIPGADGVSQEKPSSHVLTIPSSSSLSSSTVSAPSFYRPRHKDQPASEVSVPQTQISSDSSLPRPNFNKVKNHDIWKRLTTNIPKLRRNKHQRSYSVNRINTNPSPEVSRPSKPTPVCPNRSQSFSGPRMSVTTLNSGLHVLSVSTDRAGINLARHSLNSADDVAKTSLESENADEMKSDSSEPSDFITSLLAKYETDSESFACTLEAITRSHNHINLLFSKGIVEKSLQLLHGINENWRFVYHDVVRKSTCEALKNIIRHTYHNDKCVLQIHSSLGRVRDECEKMLAAIHRDSASKLIDLLSVREISTCPFYELNTFSFKTDAIAPMTQLGVLYALGEYLVVDSRLVKRHMRGEGRVSGEVKDSSKILYVKQLVCATLRNLTYEQPKNKVSISLLSELMACLVNQLDSDNEVLVNSTAALLRNLAWRAEDITKVALTKCNAAVGLIGVLTKKNIYQDGILMNITNALISLTNHSPEVKIMFCAVPGAIEYMVDCLSYSSPDGNMRVLENIIGIFCNVSQHISAMPEHMETLKQMNALDKLVSLLAKDNKYIVTQVCGILNNLSSSSLENVGSLKNLQAPHFLTLLRNKNRGVVWGAKLVIEQMVRSKNGMSQECMNGTDDLDKVLKSLYCLEDNVSDHGEGKTPTRKMRNTEETQTAKNGNIQENGASGSSKKATNKIKSRSRPSIIRKLSFMMESEPNIEQTDKIKSPVHYKILSSPTRSDLSERDMGSQSSVKTLTGSLSSVKTLTNGHDTPQNSPQRAPPVPQPYPHDAYWPADDMYSHYTYTPPYPQYLLDMPAPHVYHTQPMTHPVGYFTHPHMTMTTSHKYPYSAHTSPYKRGPCTPQPLRPYRFNEALNQHYAQQQQQQQHRMTSNSPQSRHDIAINQARLDKHSKSRSYTDSQGDLVTDL